MFALLPLTHTIKFSDANEDGFTHKYSDFTSPTELEALNSLSLLDKVLDRVLNKTAGSVLFFISFDSRTI